MVYSPWERKTFYISNRGIFHIYAKPECMGSKATINVITFYKKRKKEIRKQIN